VSSSYSSNYVAAGYRRVQGAGAGRRVAPDGPARCRPGGRRPESWPTSGTWPGSPTATGSRPAARLTGTAPLDASSGEQNGHRLSRAENRRINYMIHIAETSQLRVDIDEKAYYRRKRAEGKRPLEAIRRLSRRISDAIFRQMVADAAAAAATNGGPGGQGGAPHISRAAGSHPAHRRFGSGTSPNRTRDATPDSPPEDQPQSDGLTTGAFSSTSSRARRLSVPGLPRVRPRHRLTAAASALQLQPIVLEVLCHLAPLHSAASASGRLSA